MSENPVNPVKPKANDPYSKYLVNKQEEVKKALQEKINNLIKSDQKKKISILEKTITDSEGKLDNLKKLLNEYYFAKTNGDKEKIEEKLKAFKQELNKISTEYGNTNKDNKDTKESLETEENDFGKELDILKQNMGDNSKNPNIVLSSFMNSNKELFTNLKLEKDINNFNINISKLIKEIQGKGE